MKKILFVSLYPINPLLGGVERVTILLSNSLVEKGYDISFLALKHNDVINKNVTFSQYYFPNEDIYSHENIEFYNHFIDENKFDIIINQHGGFNLSYLFLNINLEIRKNIKVISVCHNRPLLDYGIFHKYYILPLSNEKITFKVLLHAVIRICALPLWLTGLSPKNNKKRRHAYTLNNSDVYVTLSNEYNKEIIKLVGHDVDTEKLRCIPNPNTYADSSINENKQKQILYVGALTPPQKRPDLLLKIWRKVYKKNPEWELIFVGKGDNASEKILQRYIEKHDIKRVDFRGNIEPLPSYKNASIFCLTSLFEGFPMVVTEAMQNRCVPILFSGFGAAKEMLNESSGILISPYNIRKFAKELNSLMNDNLRRAEMSKNAMQYVKRFDMCNIIEHWQEIL